MKYRDTFFTADTHFRHKRIIELCKRPFAAVEEMDEILISNWNKRVKKTDDIYHLGDFSFADPRSILDRLNGNIFLVKGNHDHKRLDSFMRSRFIWIRDLAQIEVQDQTIVLCHYAMRVWNKSHHGSWHLYGHSHGSLPDDKYSLSYDVGVDNNNFAPVSFKEVKEIMSKKEFKPIDHHGRM